MFRQEFNTAYKHWQKQDLAAFEALANVIVNQPQPTPPQIDTSRIEKLLIIGISTVVTIGVILIWKI